MKRFHVHVAVDDLEQAIGFYSALFAAEPSVIKPDYAKWMLDDPRVISPYRRAVGSQDSIISAFRLRAAMNSTRFTAVSARPTGISSSRGKPTAATPNRKNPGSAIRPEFPGRRFTRQVTVPITATDQASA